MPLSLHIPVVEQSQEGEARRLATAWATEQGLGRDEVAKVALVVSELARNLAIHTGEGGHLLLSAVENAPRQIEVISIDRGPGAANFTLFLRDGFSTAGTAGTGLGAVRRASTTFDFHSQEGFGSVLVSRLGGEASAAEPRFCLGAVNVPKKGEVLCGDAYAMEYLDGGRVRLLVADGLGHGPLAAEASGLAAQIFRSHLEVDLPSLLEKMDRAMRATRGAAVAIAEVRPSQGQVFYAGVGNIAGHILGLDRPVHMVSQNGTVGASIRRVQGFTYPWSSDSIVVMNSDGLKTQWQLDRYTGLAEKHPSLISGILFRDFNRGTDDSTVATLRFANEHRI